MSIRYRQIRRYRMSNRRRYVPQIEKLVSIRCRNDNFPCQFSKEIESLSTSTKYRQGRYRIDVDSTNRFWLGVEQPPPCRLITGHAAATQPAPCPSTGRQFTVTLNMHMHSYLTVRHKARQCNFPRPIQAVVRPS